MLRSRSRTIHIFIRPASGRRCQGRWSGPRRGETFSYTIYLYLDLDLDLYIYTYIYIYTHTYIYIYIYIYIYTYINHPLIAPRQLHCPHDCNSCNTIAILLRDIRSPHDHPFVCHTYFVCYTPYNIVWQHRPKAKARVTLYTILPSPKLYGLRHKKEESVRGAYIARNGRAIVLQYGRLCRWVGGGWKDCCFPN